MAKKRPTLNAFLASSTGISAADGSPAKSRSSAKKASPVEKPVKNQTVEPKTEVAPKTEKYEVVRHMLYLPLPVYDQLEELMFEEQRGQAKKRRMQEYLHEAVDLLFKDRGLKSIEKLIGKE